MEPKLIIKSKDIDLQLTALLGEKPADFIALLADGQDVHFMGTPYDSPRARESWKEKCEMLNDHSKKGCWPDVFTSWKREFCKLFNLADEITAKEFHPTFSFGIQRVCVAYSENLHCAIRLYEQLADRVSCWHVGGAPDGTFYAEVTSKSIGSRFCEEGQDLPLLIVKAVKRLLEAELANK